ncbi:hypothetical protein DITRI_Ditri03aG0169400 [Diplodiscus trichospermus]
MGRFKWLRLGAASAMKFLECLKMLLVMRVKMHIMLFYDASGAQGFRCTCRTNFPDSFSKIFSEIFQEEMDQFAPDIRVNTFLSPIFFYYLHTLHFQVKRYSLWNILDRAVAVFL